MKGARGGAKKLRLDQLLVSRGLADGLERARALILAGRVSVEGAGRATAGMSVDSETAIDVASPPHPFVSRGGVKLAAALDAFSLSVEGRVCLDVGASTGGFTDCFLRSGAARVYAVDTGSGQLDARLRADPRVRVRERTNARYLDSDGVPEAVGVAAIDVSFISARKILPAVARLLESDGVLVVLAKPQFEARREEVPRGGVVIDPAIHERIVREIREEAGALGLEPIGSVESPITGARGNREFLLGFVKR